LEAHSYYFLSKRSQRADSPRGPAVFGFEGEFSVVTLDFDILGKKDEMADNALKLKEEIERLCGPQFGSVSLYYHCGFVIVYFLFSENWISIQAGGVVRRFACRHEIPLLSPSPVVPSSDIKAQAKTMRGELEVAIFPDRSHPFFAGRRTIVRFCLFG
jgi:hypothetical protein